jgi:hypothetical protein
VLPVSMSETAAGAGLLGIVPCPPPGANAVPAGAAVTWLAEQPAIIASGTMKDAAASVLKRIATRRISLPGARAFAALCDVVPWA